MLKLTTRSVLGSVLLLVAVLAGCNIAAPYVDPDAITVSPQTLELAVGDTYQITAQVRATYPDVSDELIWTSRNETVATVEQDGTVTALEPGTAVITATNVASGRSASAQVLVLVEEKQTVTIRFVEADPPAGGSSYLDDLAVGASLAIYDYDTDLFAMTTDQTPSLVNLLYLGPLTRLDDGGYVTLDVPSTSELPAASLVPAAEMFAGLEGQDCRLTADPPDVLVTRTGLPLPLGPNFVLLSLTDGVLQAPFDVHDESALATEPPDLTNTPTYFYVIAEDDARVTGTCDWVVMIDEQFHAFTVPFDLQLHQGLNWLEYEPSTGTDPYSVQVAPADLKLTIALY